MTCAPLRRQRYPQRNAAAAWLRALPVLLLALSGVAMASEDGGDFREYRIKAAFLYNFTRFVEWPARSFADARSTIVIGSYCPDPFPLLLQRIVRNRAVNGRAIVVAPLQDPAAAVAAHLVFVCAERAELLGPLQALLQDRPVLLVGEAESAPGPGVISLYLADGKVRFGIDMAAAGRAGLKVSAQLQKLATSIRRVP